MPPDINAHIQIAQLQEKILDALGLPSSQAVFDFQPEEGRTALRLITVNPKHNQSFLFHTSYGADKAGALKEMLDYTLNSRDTEHTYTLQWAERGTNRLITSYFRAKDIFEVLHKFAYGRDLNAVVIYSVSLNPIA